MHRYGQSLILGGLLVALACEIRDAAPPAAQTAVTDTSLVAAVTTDRPVYARGEAVTLTLTLRNATAADVTLEFPSAQRYDFAIEDTRAPVWRWSTDKAFAQVLGEETVKPGASLVYSERFSGELTQGSYRAVATIVRMGEAITATAEFQVR